MAEVNESLTRKVADLARLELSDSEVVQFTQQLEKILHYVDQLSEANVVGPEGRPIDPMVSPLEMATPLRPDVMKTFGVDAEGRPKVLGPAPEVLYEGYKVPPII